jgi:hypothetical protein
MSKRKWFFNLIAIGLVAAFLLTACSPAATATAPAVPTSAPVAQTAAPAAQPAATQPPVPTATETPTPTATLATFPIVTYFASPTNTPDLTTPPQIQAGWNAYCRRGPGTFYFAITYLESGKSYPVVGRDGIHAWWQVQLNPQVQCWVGDPTATLKGPVDSAPLVMAPDLPSYPSSFTYSSHCDPVQNTMTVTLTWTKAQGAIGYSIYRNGDLITQQGSGADLRGDNMTYIDHAPRGVDLEYDLEAFNEYGVAPSLTAKISACV